MNGKTISAEALFAEWRSDPEFVAAYDAMEDEFALAEALIKARSRANMTQAEVAAKMRTTQTAIARLEGGGTKPSTRMLERYAEATGSRLRISFEPIDKAS